jgi:hypothetical protein
VNENRFDINLDGTSTPHRVDKKNRCIWMYEGTDEQFLVPLDYERDALYIDYRPLQMHEQVAFIKNNPLKPTEWSLDSPYFSREAAEVKDTVAEHDELDEDYVDEDELERQAQLDEEADHPMQGGAATNNRRQQKQRHRRPEIDQVLREISHDALCHCGDKTLDETITRQVMDGGEKLTTSGRLKRALGPKGKRKCRHCEAGWAQKQSTKNSGMVHKTPPKGAGTDVSADVVGPMPRSIEGHNLFLIVIDLQTKWIYIAGMKDQADMHLRFDEYLALMKREDMKHRRVHLGLSKMVTDSAMNLMSTKMKVWQAEHHIVDWQSAPYSQNQNYVESKIKHVFAGGIANLASSGFPHMLLMHMCQMKATAMNAHWVAGSDLSPLEARFGIHANFKDFHPPGAVMYVYINE